MNWYWWSFCVFKREMNIGLVLHCASVLHIPLDKSYVIYPLNTNGFFFLVLYNKLGIAHCTYLGVSGFKFLKILISKRNIVFLFQKEILYCFVWRSFFFTLTNSVDPDEMRHFIWVFTVCKSNSLGVSCIQRVKNNFLISPFRGSLYTKG